MTDIVVLSADGRIDLSPRLRDGLSWPLGTRFTVYSDGESLVMKPVSSEDEAESIKAVRIKEIKDLHGIFAGMDAPDKKELRRMFHEDHLD